MQERLNFKIRLSGTYWERAPEAAVLLDGVLIEQLIVDSDKVVEFDRDVEEDSEHVLEIQLLNKTDYDTVQENGRIVKDMLLNIHDIEIDRASIGMLLWTESQYFPNIPYIDENGVVTTQLDGCVNLGWNGSWKLKFSSPFFIWLLETM